MKKIYLITHLFISLLLCIQSFGQTLGLTRRYGSNLADDGRSTYVDGSGNTYLAGSFNGTVDFNGTIISASGTNNGFIIKNNSAGVVQWVKGLTGGEVIITDIVVDASLNVFVTGYFKGTVDFDPGVGTSNVTSNLSTFDIFVLKINSSGTFQWIKTAGGSGDDYGFSIAIDNNGDVIIGGSADDNGGNAIDFDPSAGSVIVGTTGRDGILWRLDAFNGTYVGVGKYGTTNSDELRKVAVDANGNVYVSGYYSVQLASTGVLSTVGTGNLDAFIIKYGPTYSFQWFRTFGGLQDQVAYDLDVDASGNVYSVGTYRGAAGSTSDFDYSSTLGGLAGLSNTVSDGFLCKLNSSGTFQWVKGIKGNGIDYPKKVAINSAGDVIVAGMFQGTCEFDPSTLTSSFTSNGGYDVFIAKYDANGNFTNNIQTFGEAGDDFLNGMAVNGTAFYVSGTFNNIVNVSSTTTPVNITSSGLSDAFFLSFNNCVMPPTPTINTTASTLSFCNNASVLLQVNALPVSTTVRWFANNTITSPLQSNTSYSYTTAVLTANTNFYVSASNTCGESARNIAIVTKNAPPVVAISSAPTSICAGQSATLTASNANTYSWVGGPNTSTYVVSPTVTTTFSVTGTASVGCTDVATYTLVVKSLPGISAVVSRNNACADNATITLSAGGANIYSWAAPVASNSAVNIIQSPLVTSTYTVTGTSAQGCQKSVALTVTVKPLPVVTITASKPVFCTGESLTLTFNGASLYDFGSGFSATNTVSKIYSIAGSNLVNYTAQGSNGCTITGNPFTVSVVSPPVITGSVTPSVSTCVGITSTVTRFGGNISWPTNVGLTLLNANSATISPTVTTTSFVITATSIPNCKSTSNVSISRILNTTPTISISATQTNICSGTGVTFAGVSANTNGGNITYVWSKNSVPVATTPTYGSTTLANNDQISLVITVTNPTCLTSNTATSNSVNMTTSLVSPSVTISTPNTTICSGDNVPFTATLTNGGSNPRITWKVGNSYFNTNSNLFTTNALTNGINVLCIITSSGNCLSSATATSSGIIMNVNPITSLVGMLPSSPTTTCSSITYSLSATGINNSFEWSTGYTSIGNNSSINASSTDTYSATVTGTCGTMASNVVNLTKLSPPQITGTFASETICGSNFNILSTPISGDNLTFVWSNGANTSFLSPSSSGNYTLTVIGSCGSAVSNTVSLVAIPTTNISSQSVNTTVPSGNFANFSVVATGDNLTYLWNSGETSPNINTSISGIYTATVIGTCGVVESNPIELTAIIGCEPPTILIQPQSTQICEGNIANLNISATGTGVSYAWSNGSTNDVIVTSVLGNYLVTVSGICGKVISSPATLSRKQSTQITTQPISNNTLCGGNAINLSVAATGEAPITYNWNSGENTSLISKTIEGTYLVTVSGACGSIVSNPANIVSCSITNTSVTSTVTSTITSSVGLFTTSEQTKAIRIFPNPTADGKFTISNTEIGSTLNIYSSQGNLLYILELDSENTEIKSNLPKGMYLVKVGTTMKKLEVE
ncbi:MAG: T9SS type A sorting domain-containing protein [Bacteroidota bacterium]|nr:T9SS type A sorting domain-containing protein [Bacteroidota bacterium]